jgi:Zn-dependent protease with chaperone function
MVQALEPAERRVLLAHERCHLRNRHWLFRLAIRLAAALLPTLRPAIGQCDQALERWADEDAADAVGDRQLAAAAVAKAALAGAAAGRAKLAAGFSHGLVAARVEALLEEPIPHRSAPLALPTATLLIATVAVLSAASTLEDLFELARHL